MRNRIIFIYIYSVSGFLCTFANKNNLLDGMMKLVRIYIYIITVALLLGGCSVSKFIPEGQYLLDEVHISSDNKEIKSSEMYSYVRQKPNSKWFSLVKLPMYIYCASGKDSTKWINKILRKMGDAPRIYDADVAEETRLQILGAVQNKGYLGAQVSLEERTKKNKLDTYYKISSGRPYVVSSMKYNIEDYVIRGIVNEGFRQQQFERRYGIQCQCT